VEPQAKPVEPHERWQADFKVKMKVPGLGKIDVFNVRDDASPVKIGSFVCPCGEWDDRWVQKALRTAFTNWGLCDRFQTDRDTHLVSVRRNPFPTRFILWLAGLGIEHEIAKSAPANGCVERFHRTWFDRAGNYHSYELKVTERWTMVDENVIEYEATMEDPQVFERPWTIKMPLYRRLEEGYELPQFKCVEFVEELMYGQYRKGGEFEQRLREEMAEEQNQ
jgi:hypothetical protein